MLAVGALAVLLFDLVVDPYRMVDLVDVPGLNARKPEAEHQIRLLKAYDVERAHARTLLMGNSRVEVGLDPESIALAAAPHPIYNMAIPGAGLREQIRYFQHARAAGPVQFIVLGLDFVDFLTWPTVSARSPRERAPYEERLLVLDDGTPNPERLRALVHDATTAFFSFAAFRDSVLTVLEQGPGNSDRTPLGFNPLEEYNSIVHREGHYALFYQRDQENIAQRARGPKDVRLGDGRPGPELEELRRLLAFCRAQRIGVLLFIHPYHARLIETFRITGLWPAFETWKRELVRLIEEDRRANPDTVPLQLWDFSGIGPWTSETVPEEGDTRTEMRWYWEAGHYKKSLGDLALDRMLSPEHAPAGATDFGMTLTAANLEAVLAADRRAELQYRASHLATIELLETFLPAPKRPAP